VFTDDQARTFCFIPIGSSHPCQEVPAGELGTDKVRWALNRTFVVFVWFSYLLCIDVPLIVPDDIVLDEHIGRGIQPGEVELPGDNVGSPGSLRPVFSHTIS
jgi:hypothetical protein